VRFDDLPFPSNSTIDGLLQKPEELQIFHLSAKNHKVYYRFLNHVSATFTNLRVLSLVTTAVHMWPYSDPLVTFPQVTTLFIETLYDDWLILSIQRWLFPALKHLSFELWAPLRSHDLLSRFRGFLRMYEQQLLSLRIPSLQINLPVGLTYPQLEALAIDFVDFNAPESFLALVSGTEDFPGMNRQSSSGSDVQAILQKDLLTQNNSLGQDAARSLNTIKHLIHTPNLYRRKRESIYFLFTLYDTPEYRRQLKKDYYSGKLSKEVTHEETCHPENDVEGTQDGGLIELKIYQGMMSTIAYCPELEAIHLPKEVESICTGTLTEETASNFDDLRRLCELRNVRILDMDGKPFPIHLMGIQESRDATAMPAFHGVEENL
jgi:hypothetical protein